MTKIGYPDKMPKHDKNKKYVPYGFTEPIDSIWYYLMYAPESNEDRVKYWEFIKGDVEKLFESESYECTCKTIEECKSKYPDTKPKDGWEIRFKKMFEVVVKRNKDGSYISTGVDHRMIDFIKEVESQAEQRGRDEREERTGSEFLRDGAEHKTCYECEQ